MNGIEMSKFYFGAILIIEYFAMHVRIVHLRSEK
jgi:hypothetical protein